MKNKAMLAIIILAVGFLSAVVVTAGLLSNGNRQVLQANGFILSAGQDPAVKKVQFAQETAVKARPQDQIELKDVQGSSFVLPSDSIVHYEEGTVSAFRPGVLVDISEIGKEYINNYSIPAGMMLQNNQGSYAIQTATGATQLDGFLLKVSEEKSIICADHISVEFGPGDVRSVNGYLEVKYVDGDIVQLVTDENVWYTISPAAKARFGNGIEFWLSEKKLVNGAGELSLPHLPIDSDHNIQVLSSAQDTNIVVPKFDIQTIDGDQGEDGITGVTGESGESGIEGDAGSAGTQGSTGSTGGEGGSGADGNDGGTSGIGPGSGGEGADGDIVSMPVFTIVDFNVTATAVSGKLSIVDDNGMLSKGGTITIIQEGTSDVLYAENVIHGGQSFDFDSLNAEFAANNLKPDTKYRLVVTSPYTVGSQEYVRDFISRVFYTDSTGVFTNKGAVGLNAANVVVSKASYSNASAVTVYLMTNEQSASFDPDDPTTYLNLVPINFTDIKTEDTAVFDNLNSNTTYVVRTVVTSNQAGASVSTLTDSQLKFKTLKEPPTIASPTAITVVSGGYFQLYLGKVEDPDNGIQSYRYIIEQLPAGGGTPVYVKTLTSASKNPVSLYVDSSSIHPNTTYQFKVIAEFNDNEKVVEYETVYSDSFIMTATSLPDVSFILSAVNADTPGATFNTIDGKLLVNPKGSRITIDPLSPMTWVIEVPGFFKKSYTATDLSKVNKTADGIYEIPVHEVGLKAGEQIRFTVWAYVDLDDGRVATERLIGTWVQNIPDPADFIATWSIPPNADDFALSQLVRFESVDNLPENNIDYEAKTLGEIVITLYAGTGTGKVKLADKTLKNNDDKFSSSLKGEVVDKALLLTEDFFNIDKSKLTASSYTLEITSASDFTYDTTLDGKISAYVNRYTFADGSNTKVVYKNAAPPSLESATITAVPVLNMQAATYGMPANPALDGTTVIGFRVASQYDNYATLARSITYYAFSKKTIDDYYAANPTTSTSPIKAGLALFKTPEIPITNTMMSVPPVAFLMDSTATLNPDKSLLPAGMTMADGTQVYRAPKEAVSGLDRGEKYYFAYTVNYASTGGATWDKVYPYDISAYPQQNMLKTGDADAPRQAVKFNAYPWTSTNTTYDWKYRYVDPDTAWPTGQQQFNWSCGTVSATTNSVYPANQWNNVQFGSSVLLSAGHNLQVQTTWLPFNTANYPGTERVLTLFNTPFDGLRSTMDISSINCTMDTSSLGENQLNFTVSGPLSDVNKIAALKITFQHATKGSKTVYRALPTPTDMGAVVSATAKLPLSQISALVDNTTLGITVAFLYDEGVSGYNFESNQLYALQLVQNAAFGEYKARALSGSSLINYPTPAGSVFASTFSALADTAAGGTLHYVGQTDNFNGNLALACAQNGMLYNGGVVANEIVVPKRLKASNVKLNTSLTIASIVPTVIIYDTDVTSGVDQISLKYSLDGIESITGANIEFKVYAGTKGTGNNITYDTTPFATYPAPKTDTGTITLDGLSPNTSYKIDVWATLSSGARILIKGDSSLYAQAIYYYSTVSDVVINITKFTPFATDYDNKGYNLTYTLNQVIGFNVKYRLVTLNAAGTETGTYYTHDQLIANGIIAPHPDGAPYTPTNTDTLLMLPGAHSLPAGNYRLYVEAFAKSGGEQLGTGAHYDFTRYGLREPTYYVTATPSIDSTTSVQSMSFKVTVSDTDKVMVGNGFNGNWNGLYKVRFYSNDGTDITPNTYRDLVYDISAPRIFKLDNLASDADYRIKVFSVYDMANAGGFLPISDASVNVDATPDTYLKYEQVERTLGSSGIKLGTVTLAPQSDTKKVMVEFTNGVNLEGVTMLDYSITSDDGGILLSGRLTPPTIVKSSATYSYCNLPDTLNVAGTYYITIRFYKDTTDVGTLSFVYNRR